jgi:ADP-heptose:LPS heptosyltransferase
MGEGLMLYVLITWLAAPILYLRLMLRRPHAGQRRVLLIQTAKIGDLVCTTPIIASLKASWPGCHLTVMVNPLCVPLLAHDPAVDALWGVPAIDWQGFAGKLRLLKRLRQAGFDDCIVLSPNVAFLLLPLWAGIPVRAAMLSNFPSRSLDGCARFLTHHERHRNGRLVLDTELELLRQLGCKQLTARKSLHVAPLADTEVSAFLADRTAPRIGIGISSGNKLKALSGEQLATLCQRLLSLLPHDLVLIGTAADRPMAAGIMASCGNTPRILDAAGAFALDILPALMPRLDGYFGVDSGVTYIADTFDIPTVDLMGPANADDQRPTGTQAVVIRTDLPCAPCSHAFRTPYHCARGDRACIVHASLEALATQIARSLKP